MRRFRHAILSVAITTIVWRVVVGLVTRRWHSGDRPPIRRFTGEERSVATDDGAVLHVVERGDGPLIVLAHGIGGRLDHWSAVADQLVSQGFRVVAFDQRGHNRSSMGVAAFSPHRLGADLIAVIRSCGTAAVVVCGHSMGGIGIEGALSQGLSDETNAIMLVSTVERPAGEVSVSPRAAAAFINWTKHETLGRLMMRGGFGKQAPHVDDLDELRSTWSAMDVESFNTALAGLKKFDVSDDLKKCGLVAYVLCGDRDLVTPIRHSRRIHKLLANSTLRELEGVGHMAIWEAPDVVVEHIVLAASSS